MKERNSQGLAAAPGYARWKEKQDGGGGGAVCVCVVGGRRVRGLVGGWAAKGKSAGASERTNQCVVIADRMQWVRGSRGLRWMVAQTGAITLRHFSLCDSRLRVVRPARLFPSPLFLIPYGASFSSLLVSFLPPPFLLIVHSFALSRCTFSWWSLLLPCCESSLFCHDRPHVYKNRVHVLIHCNFLSSYSL